MISNLNYSIYLNMTSNWHFLLLSSNNPPIKSIKKAVIILSTFQMINYLRKCFLCMHSWWQNTSLLTIESNNKPVNAHLRELNVKSRTIFIASFKLALTSILEKYFKTFLAEKKSAKKKTFAKPTLVKLKNPFSWLILKWYLKIRDS